MNLGITISKPGKEGHNYQSTNFNPNADVN